MIITLLLYWVSGS